MIKSLAIFFAMATDLSDEECARLQEIFKKRAEELKIEREEKARNFEAFINEKLKVDLRKTLLERDKIYEQISEYLEVCSSVCSWAKRSNR